MAARTSPNERASSGSGGGFGDAAWASCRARRAADPGLANQPCRDFRDLDSAQDSAYELSMKYVRLAQDVRQRQLREATQWVHDLVYHAGGGTTGNPFQFAGDLTVLSQDAARASDPTRVEARAPQLKGITPLPLPGPMDGNAPDGTSWVSDAVKRRIKERLGLIKPDAAPNMGPGPGGDALRPLAAPQQ